MASVDEVTFSFAESLESKVTSSSGLLLVPGFGLLRPVAFKVFCSKSESVKKENETTYLRALEHVTE